MHLQNIDPIEQVLHWENNSLIPVGLAVTKLLMRRYFFLESKAICLFTCNGGNRRHTQIRISFPKIKAICLIICKRYFLVEKTKDASRIGLLVGTLGSQQCTEMLEKLRKVTLSLSFNFITQF